MAERPPRYDLPQAAPPPLRLVQRFVNTVNLERGDDWLPDWFEENGVPSPGAGELERARAVREALRELLYANNGLAAADPVPALDEAARRARLTIDFRSRAVVA